MSPALTPWKWTLLTLILLSPWTHSRESQPETAVDHFFEQRDYRPLLHQALLEDRGAFLDQIYKQGSKVILFTWGLKPQSTSDIGKLISHEKGFYYNSNTKNSVPYTLFFYHFSGSEAKSLSKQLESNYFSHFEFLKFFMGPKAQAETPVCESGSNDILLSFGNELNQKALQEIAWTCASAAGSGVESKAGEMIDTVTPENFPSLDLSTFWSESVKTYETLKELVPQLQPLMNELSGLLEKFHPSLKLNLICSAIGSQTVEAITPGGVIKKLVFLKSKIEGLKKMMAMLKGISKLYDKHPKSKTLEEATQRIGACAI